jgi:Sulfotransferase family
MLCSHEKKFIFLKTRKTAGTSVEIFFERFCLPLCQFQESHDIDQKITDAGIVGGRAEWFSKRPDFYNHMPASEIRNKLGREIFDTYYRFCTMRNPFDKVVSHFWWRTRNSFESSNELFSKIKGRFTEFVVCGFGSFNDRAIFMIDGHSVELSLNLGDDRGQAAAV